MEYKGYRFDNLYRDIIDELKDEMVSLKKKMKDYKYREEDLEDEFGDMSKENKKLKGFLRNQERLEIN